ncbi:hypothetical protein Swoo_1856 [Shewanella woodyi ATCC 51908]|uniref:Uncharacterized protein n=2 Tax=Shewanella woodyi TaxID=60961 RepID=B1KPI7_SHEWM|nr:hypothetical protein Swoo_1856 [Shewanella woodyi ATCC 51908]
MLLAVSTRILPFIGNTLYVNYSLNGIIMLKKSYCAALLTTLLISTSSMAGTLNVEPNKGGAAERANTQLSNGNTQSVADIDIKAVLSPTLNLRPQIGVRRPMGDL